jgi:hypothetical protein
VGIDQCLFDQQSPKAVPEKYKRPVLIFASLDSYCFEELVRFVDKCAPVVSIYCSRVVLVQEYSSGWRIFREVVPEPKTSLWAIGCPPGIPSMFGVVFASRVQSMYCDNAIALSAHSSVGMFLTLHCRILDLRSQPSAVIIHVRGGEELAKRLYTLRHLISTGTEHLQPCVSSTCHS